MKVNGDEKLTERWFWNKSQERHIERLKTIKKTAPAEYSAPRPRRSSFIRLKFHELERKNEIYKDNMKLLHNLCDISKGRRSTSTKNILESIKNIPKPKSLNVEARKNEAKKINAENEALARRILKTTNGFSFKKFDNEYQNSVKYRKTISKAKFRKLPGLDARTKSTGSKSNLNSENSKKRTRSFYDPNTTMYKESKNKKLSPVLGSVNAEIINIEQEKEPVSFTVQGKNQINNKKVVSTKVSNNKKLDPIKR